MEEIINFLTFQPAKCQVRHDAPNIEVKETMEK
jgi:hypothetical protein